MSDLHKILADLREAANRGRARMRSPLSKSHETRATVLLTGDAQNRADCYPSKLTTADIGVHLTLSLSQLDIIMGILTNAHTR